MSSAPLVAVARLLHRWSATAADTVAAGAGTAFGLETLLNRHIQESSRARDLLAALEGKSLAVVVQGLDVSFRLAASEAHLSLQIRSADSDPDATAVVSGTPLMLLGLIRSSAAEGFRASGAELSGDARTAETFAELLRHARPDIEEELAWLIGDLPAHELAGIARGTHAWSRRAGSALAMNASEFLQEEARQLPPRTEVDAFTRDVERLRDDVERAGQRLDRLEAGRPGAPSPRRAAVENRGFCHGLPGAG